MPELKCTVDTCLHNKEFLCDLAEIKVDGQSAKDAEATKCASFKERVGNTYSNRVSQASPITEITCQAVECKYNDHCNCEAGKISVEGSNACHSCDTECASFDCECR